MGVESLSGSPSSVIIWKISFCARLGSLAGEAGGWWRRLVGWGSWEEGMGFSPLVWGGAFASKEAGFPVCVGIVAGVGDCIDQGMPLVQWPLT